MRRNVFCGALLAIGFLTLTSRAKAETDEAEDRSLVTAGIVYPLATNANHPNVITNADISLGYNRVGSVEGGQVGAGVVHARENVDGAQVAGIGSIGGTVHGVQLSGVANVAEEVEGLQLSLVNVSRRVRGLQLGLVNVAEEVDGAALGLISISRNSVHPIVWGSNLEYTNAGVKFTSKYLFTLIGAHYGTHEADFDNVGATFALGGHIPLPSDFDVEVQAAFTQLAPSKRRGTNKENSWFAPQVMAGYSVARHFRVFAGGGVRWPLSVEIGREVTRPELMAGLQF